jgi:hypothetical protein
VSKHKLIAGVELETLATEADVTVYSLHDPKAGETLRSLRGDAIRLREMVFADGADDPDLAENNVYDRLVALSIAVTAASETEKAAAILYAAVDSSAATVSALNQRLPNQLRAGFHRTAMRARGPVGHPVVAHRRIPVGPPLRGRPRHMEAHSRMGDRPAVVDDQSPDPQTLNRG